MDMKVNASTDAPEFVRPLLRWGSVVMLVLLGFSTWRNGVIAPLLQSEDFTEYIADSEINAPGWSRQMTISIQAHQVDIYGMVWDGVSFGGVVGGMFSAIDLSAPSDLVPCVVAASANQAQCMMRREGEKIKSHCPNAYSCDWRIPIPARGVFSIVVFDADSGLAEGTWEFVDAVHIGDSSDDDAAAVDQATRQLINLVSPTTVDLPGFGVRTFNRREAERRERHLPVVSPNSGDQRLELPQSYIALFF